VRKIRDRRQRLSAVVASSKNKKTCVSCGGSLPIYARSGLAIKCDFSRVAFEDPEEAQYCQRPFTAAEIRLILLNISDEDCTLMCLNPRVSRPENLVLTMLVVPPPIVRPSIAISEGSRARGQDDLTNKLCDIVKANNTVKQVLEKEAASIPRLGLSLSAQQVVSDLAFHVSAFMNNDIRGQRQSMQRNGLPSKSITSRLKGKDGRIRGSLMGKRVNFSARSVLPPRFFFLKKRGYHGR
jgi:DNA-directed RNA polymerase II subunit RPB1